jgi:radical SAM superfamily enzyme YgiQ (UPF0313 family)
MKALLVQPPFTQLNSPYPAVHYLEAFLRSRGMDARALDHSIELYRAVFSRRGLAPAFDAARRILDGEQSVAGEGRDAATISQLERYVSYEGSYLEWIDALVAFLSGGDPAFAHRLAQAVELPQGMRAEAFLDARGGRIASHEARGLATAMLEDLGDLVSYALDPSFGTVRYGERIAASASRFSALCSALDASPLLESTYKLILEAEWKTMQEAPSLLLVSVPFPGCLLGALACARSCREAFGSRTRILLGGGYVSTELRGLRDVGIFDFCDYLCFDAGYGSIDSILEVEAGAPRERLYKTMYRDSDGRLVAAGFEAADEASAEPGLRRTTPCDARDRIARSEMEALVSIAPDYASVDFDRYIQVVDSDNPMHRLWSDSPWLKYGLAHGCYWRRCSFCDTSLEYVSLFSPADIASIAAAADAASARTGLFGIHFVDEAMPLSSLLAFARANEARSLAGAKAFHFWGNVRFDSAWNEDNCEFLAARGLVAVSGGIEIATEGGLEMTDKGFDLAGLVRTLVAMRRAGLLVHAYLIYGFPGQTRQDIVDSAEVCRQLFAAGLVDSAFWHRFVLTRHSRMYGEWLNGNRPGLEPVDRTWDFANNDLGFAGGEAFDEFDGPLAATLEAWMSGEGLERLAAGRAARQLEEAGLRRARRGASDVAGPSVDLVESLVARAEIELAASRPRREGRAHWIAGMPVLRAIDGRRSRLTWTYRGEARELTLPREAAPSVASTICALARESAGQPYADLAAILAAILATELGLMPESLSELRASGLVVV